MSCSSTSGPAPTGSPPPRTTTAGQQLPQQLLLQAGPEVTLADGTRASAGDRILTRRNDRRLVLSPTDWVKNGDRWTVTHVEPDGALRAVHAGSARSVLLPAAYVAEHVTLGYASTIHTAQGSTADTAHTVLTGREDRQLLYVAATRGRAGNHLYLQTPQPGDEQHTPPGPDMLRPPTPAETLTRILARDGAQTSATSTQHTLTDPAVLLGQAAARYCDSLTVAGRHRHELGAHLTTDAANNTASDTAAPTAAPLPWLPPVPGALADHAGWGPYLAGQAQQVHDLARQLDQQARTWTPNTAPNWARPLVNADDHAARGSGDAGDLVARLAVWRASQQVPDDDRRPAGPPPTDPHTQHAHQQLRAAATSAHRATSPAGAAWRQQLGAVAPALREDPDWPRLAARLDTAAATRHNVAPVLQRALSSNPLPDELPAAALIWRLTPHLPTGTSHPATAQPDAPAVHADQAAEPTGAVPPQAAAVPPEPPVSPRERWKPLADTVDPRLSACPSWPAFAGTLERAHRAGHDVAERLPVLAAQAPLDEHRPASALSYRLVADCPAAVLQLTAAQHFADDRQRLAALHAMTGGTTRPAGPAAPTRGRGPAR